MNIKVTLPKPMKEFYVLGDYNNWSLDDARCYISNRPKRYWNIELPYGTKQYKFSCCATFFGVEIDQFGRDIPNRIASEEIKEATVFNFK